MSSAVYFKHSSHRFYGAVIALVMLTLYEVLIIWENVSGIMVRNAPEAWFRFLLNTAGVSYHHVTFLMITLSLVAIPIFYRSEIGFNARVLLYLVLESIIWAVVSGFVIRLVIVGLFLNSGSPTGSIISDLGLAIGAGLFEELFFRVLLTTALIWSFTRMLRTRWLAVVMAVLIASLAFSLAHYIGASGDVFTLYSFTFRFVAGLWFTTLYAVRGFAIVCLSHAFYDIIILLF
jgi:membrane protease YdiL (CAAX protease family)